MDDPKNPFSFVVPLQHMVKVKLIETLWRNSEIRQIPTDELFNNYRVPVGCYRIEQDLIDSLEKSIDQLPIPEMIKNELLVFAIEMVYSALNWTTRIDAELLNHNLRQEDCAEMFEYFVHNFSWGNMGCVDAEKMIKSYVSNKTTIDYKTWKLLCDYCLEDEIIRFSPTIDWEKCKSFTDSPCCIYWYWKIHGKFPTEEMFADVIPELNISYSDFKAECHAGGLYDADNMVQSMLSRNHSYFQNSLSTIRYWRRELRNEGKFQELHLNREVLDHQLGVDQLYWLQDVKDEKWLESDYATDYIYYFAARWPLALFSQHWIDALEDRPVVENQIRLFIRLSNERDNWYAKHREIVFDRAICDPFKDHLKVFNEKFGADKDLAYHIYYMSFMRQNITACNIMFEVEGNSLNRKKFLSTLEVDNVANFNELRNADFCTRFMEEVLVGDDEKELFRRIMENRAMENFDYDDR